MIKPGFVNCNVMAQGFFYLLFSLTLMIVASDINAEADEHISVQVNTVYIEMRTGPGRSYPVFYIAENGETITLLNQRTDWLKIRTDKGKEGWVAVDSIAATIDQQGRPLSVSIPRFDQFYNRQWEMGIMLGDFGGTDVITAYGGYHFTHNLSVEVALSENFGNVSSGQNATISLVNQPFPEWRYSPFFTLGGGVRKTDPRSNLVQTEDRTDNVVTVGAGIRVYLSKHYILRMQYKNHTVLTSRDDDIEVEEWKIGISTFF